MSELWKSFVEDPRTICRYGVRCYQKSPQHHADYKHPPQKGKRKIDRKPVNTKRLKMDLDDKDISELDTTSQVNNNSNKNDETLDIQKLTIPPKCEEKATELYNLPTVITYHDATDRNELFKELFLVNMPRDFFKFYECLKEENNAEQMLSNVNLQLIGPYELLLGKLAIVDDKELYLTHWRFFYDPPEFQSVLKRKGKSEYHIGYFRDSPEEDPVFLGSNDSAKDCTITPIAANIFAAVIIYLNKESSRSPFSSMPCQKFISKVTTWAKEHNFSLKPYDVKARLQNINTRSLHGAGIVVPYNKKTKVGYRNLVENDATIKKIFKKIESATSTEEKDKALAELQPVITYASIGVDECDFGVGLEMGLNLFASGLKDLEQSAVSLLSSAYPLLKRDVFSKIIQVHLKRRRRGAQMSLLNINET